VSRLSVHPADYSLTCDVERVSTHSDGIFNLFVVHVARALHLGDESPTKGFLQQLKVFTTAARNSGLPVHIPIFRSYVLRFRKPQKFR